MDQVRCPIVELRQYTLHQGQRDALIELFDREFIESQEALGITVIGQFRDLDRPDRFVWLRGFPDLAARGEALPAFYGGPAWKAHRAAANATMIDSDNVLLLRPAGPRSGFPAPVSPRPPAGAAAAPGALIYVTLCYRDRPFGQDFADFFDQRARPALTEAGAAPVAWLQTEYAENNFPALPVRTGEHVFAWFTRFAGPDEAENSQRALASSPAWRDEMLPGLPESVSGEPGRLRLAPTARSLLR